MPLPPNAPAHSGITPPTLTERCRLYCKFLGSLDFAAGGGIGSRLPVLFAFDPAHAFAGEFDAAGLFHLPRADLIEIDAA